MTSIATQMKIRNKNAGRYPHWTPPKRPKTTQRKMQSMHPVHKTIYTTAACPCSGLNKNTPIRLELNIASLTIHAPVKLIEDESKKNRYSLGWLDFAYTRHYPPRSFMGVCESCLIGALHLVRAVARTGLYILDRMGFGFSLNQLLPKT